jgi:rod shape-determining protein MreD
MTRIDIRYQIWLFVLLVVLQVPLLYKYVLFDVAFGFFYVGFLLFFPYRTAPVIQLTAGFLVGLLMDIFSNTPGMHAAASVFIMFVKDYWLILVAEEPEDDVNLSVYSLGNLTTLMYLLPLIFAHHLIIFTVEYGRWSGYGVILYRIFWSSLFTFLTVIIVDFLIAPRRSRA